jgi:hypothetical protein
LLYPAVVIKVMTQAIGGLAQRRATWLSVTPEPERELPRAVATLMAGRIPSEEEVDAEQARIESLLLNGSHRAWLAYLHGVVELIENHADALEPDVARARDRATAVIANHHNLLLGLPGRGAQLSASDRERLSQIDEINEPERGHR